MPEETVREPDHRQAHHGPRLRHHRQRRGCAHHHQQDGAAAATGAETRAKKVPPVVKFSWGAYSFTGMVEQYQGDHRLLRRRRPAAALLDQPHPVQPGRHFRGQHQQRPGLGRGELSPEAGCTADDQRGRRRTPGRSQQGRRPAPAHSSPPARLSQPAFRCRRRRLMSRRLGDVSFSASASVGQVRRYRRLSAGTGLSAALPWW